MAQRGSWDPRANFGDVVCEQGNVCVCVCERERERVKRGHREVSYLVKNLSNKPPMMVRCPIVLQWQQAP
jgi:hypothetical protein